MTNHGTPLSPGPGCATVFMGGKPAWRAQSDMHVCPLVAGTKPHAGGVVANGSTTVMIGGMFAARRGDSVVEVGAVNVITTGAPSVVIG